MGAQEVIERYFRAFRERDREALRAVLTPGFHHRSAYGEWRDRDAMIDAIWPGVGEIWAARIEVFGEPPELMVRYEHDAPPGSPRPRRAMAEYVRLEGDRIAEIEVYTGRELG